MKKLYFIENIHTVSLSNEEGDVKYTITLEDVERSEKIAQRELNPERFDDGRRGDREMPAPFIFLRDINEIPKLKDSHYVLHEGQYVYQDTETGDFEAAYKDPLVKSRQNKNLRLRNKLIALQREVERDEDGESIQTQAFLENAYVESYHVNVGHGNCRT